MNIRPDPQTRRHTCAGASWPGKNPEEETATKRETTQAPTKEVRHEGLRRASQVDRTKAGKTEGLASTPLHDQGGSRSGRPAPHPRPEPDPHDMSGTMRRTSPAG